MADISYNSAVTLRGDISKLLTSAQASTKTAKDAAAVASAKGDLAVQANIDAQAHRDAAAASALAVSQDADVVANAAAVTQAMLDEAEASAAAAAGSATAAATSLASFQVASFLQSFNG